MYTVHLRATRQEFAPENIVIFAGINELKSSPSPIILVIDMYLIIYILFIHYQ